MARPPQTPRRRRRAACRRHAHRTLPALGTLVSLTPPAMSATSLLPARVGIRHTDCNRPRMASAGGKVRIGISGWRYAPWRGRFYPDGLAQRQELAFASRMLPTIEINGSFYSLQTPASYQSWHD